MASPVVSIVVSTYNRSNVLRYTLESVLRSRFADWEMLVVGDACTDDTAEVVASCNDDRIRFLNLERNCGEQSGPNNEGMRRARGRYIALLNHDDLWTEDHLETCVAAIESKSADFVFSRAVAIPASGAPRLVGMTRTGRYDPLVVAPASTWLFQRELVDAAGLWRPATSLYVSPSQDWLYRLYRKGRELVPTERVTVIIPYSGGRSGAYSERRSDENRRLAEALVFDPHFVSRMTLEAVASERRGSVGHALKGLVGRALLRAGVHPFALVNRVRHGRRGGFIDSLRKTRGLPPLERTRS